MSSIFTADGRGCPFLRPLDGVFYRVGEEVPE